MKNQRIKSLGVYHEDCAMLKSVLEQALDIEKARYVARDIGK